MKANLETLGNKSKKRRSAKIKLGTFYFDNQIIVELSDNSMEPNYLEGTKFRCEEVPYSSWSSIYGGIYAIKCFNALVVKRFKNKHKKGMIRLHSDNPASGAHKECPIRAKSNIWKAVRVVDAPVGNN